MILDEYIKLVRCERCVMQLGIGHNLQKQSVKKETPKLRTNEKRISLIF